MDSKLEDGELIQQILAGDSKQFSLLVTKYQRFVFSTAFGILGNQQDAEDVTQDVFLAAFRKLATFEGRSSFLTWLRRIAFNLSIDLRRKRKANGSPAPLSFHEETATSAELSVTDAIITNETVSSVRHAIDQLPEEQRHVVILRDIQNMNYGEIAELLTIPIGTVRSRLHRARLELKSILERLGASPIASCNPTEATSLGGET